MPTPPYAKVLVSVNGAATTYGKVTCPGGASIALTAQSTERWFAQRWEIYDYPPGFTCPSGWTADGAGVYFTTAITPQQFNLPALGPNNWGGYAIRLRINNAPVTTLTDATRNPAYASSLVDESTILSMLSASGFEGITLGEATHADALRSWTGTVMRTLRTVSTFLVGGGAAPPARASTRGLVFRGDATSFVVSSGSTNRWNDADARGTYFASPSSARDPSTGIGRGGLRYMRTGIIGGTARFMVQTFGTPLNAHSYTQITFYEPAQQQDTTTRVFLDTDSTLRVGWQGAGSPIYGNKCWLAFNGTFTWGSPAGPMTAEPGVGQPFEQAMFGDASNFNLVNNGIVGTNYSLFNAASNATTINRITFGIDDAHSTDALSTEAKVYETLICNVELTNDEIDAVVSDFTNQIGGYLLLTDTNSQGTPVPAHVTSGAYSFTQVIAKQSSYWVVSRAAGTGGITTPQLVSRWATNTLPMLSSRFHKRFAGFWEGENDCYNNGASSTPTDTTYAATAWNNMKQWADLARQGGAQKIFILTILPTTVGGVPANYENLRLAVNALIRAHYADISGVTGQPYFDYLCDIGSTNHAVSPYGDIALVASPAYSDGTQHIGDAGHQWIADQLTPVIDAWAAL